MIQSRWPICLSGFLVLLALAAPAAQAQVLEVELKVKGLACPFCAYGLEQKLKKLSGAQAVEVFLDEDRAQVQFDGPRSPAVDTLPRLVHDAGFKLEEVRLTVRGERAQKAGQAVLLLPDKQMFLLAGEGAGNDLIQNVLPGTTVEVKGTVESKQPAGHQSHPPTLRVESYHPVERRRLPAGGD